MTLLVVGASVAFAAGIGWLLTRLHRRFRSLGWTILGVAVAAVVVASFAVVASTQAMLLTTAELRLVLSALLLGAVLGVLVAVAVTVPLTDDLRRLADAAQRVTGGDLAVRTGVDRNDEVGQLAGSVDRMIEQLSRLEEDRRRDLTARQRLLTSIGHDLRTPLSSLQAALEALQDGVAPDPERYLASMGADVDLLRTMVDDLLVLVRLEAGELRLERLPVDLVEIADGAVEAVAPLATRQGVALQLRADGAVVVDGDPLALNRVLRNLLDNALQHTPDGSCVEVTVTADSAATVRVRDEGAGFPDGFVAQAFDRFTRADPARGRQGGVGLGLAIARELVDAHQGQIWIEGQPATTVVFRLPLARQVP